MSGLELPVYNPARKHLADLQVGDQIVVKEWRSSDLKFAVVTDCNKTTITACYVEFPYNPNRPTDWQITFNRSNGMRRGYSQRPYHKKAAKIRVRLGSDCITWDEAMAYNRTLQDNTIRKQLCKQLAAYQLDDWTRLTDHQLRQILTWLETQPDESENT